MKVKHQSAEGREKAQTGGKMKVESQGRRSKDEMNRGQSESEEINRR